MEPMGRSTTIELELSFCGLETALARVWAPKP